jgi:hypothetical protein
VLEWHHNDRQNHPGATTQAAGAAPDLPDGSKVYVINSNSSTVSVIDTATNTVVGSPITLARTACARPRIGGSDRQDRNG